MSAQHITSRAASAHTSRHPREEIALLRAPEGSRAARLAERLRSHRPITAFALVLLLGYVVIAAATIALGFLLVDVVLPVHVIGHDDEAVNTWFAAHRTGTRNDASYVGSSIGDIPVLPVLVTLEILVAAAFRRWRIVGFILGAILIEVATYRITSLIVHRERPSVPRLDHLPVNQSFPSGHVAASVSVYVALALLVTSRFARRSVHVIAWTLALLLPLVVATARMYRGMHHPTDVASAALMGLCAVAISLLAVRTADATAARRAGAREPA